VTLSNGTAIDYTLDAMNRRVGRSVNGTITQRYAYSGAIGPAAEIDASGNVVTRFVYGTRPNVPDYMVRGGVTYRFVTDRLGTVRMVVDVASGTSAQELDYDEFGRVIRDTHPGLQPFGYAGGIYDEMTGLVHFGVREYDAETGRWGSRDPIGFGGGGTNLYAYAINDPIDLSDANGRCPICVIMLGAGVTGAGFDLLTQLIVNGGDVSCINWQRVLASGLVSAALGGLGELAEGAIEAAEVGEGAVGERQIVRMSREESWGNPNTLEGHYAEHGSDFGANSAADYADKASQFLQRAQSEGLPTKIDADGVIRVYDPNTNTFGSFNPNGTARTFFKPTSPTYWSRQPGSPPWVP